MKFLKPKTKKVLEDCLGKNPGTMLQFMIGLEQKKFILFLVRIRMGEPTESPSWTTKINMFLMGVIWAFCCCNFIFSVTQHLKRGIVIESGKMQSPETQSIESHFHHPV